MRVNSTGFMAVVHRVAAFLRLFERFQKYLEMMPSTSTIES